MSHSIPASVISFIAAFFITSGAQSASLPEESERLLLPNASNGPASATIETPRAYAELEAGKESSIVSLKFSRSGQTKPIDWGTRREVSTNFSSWGITLTAPVNKNNEDTDVANLDGLANAFSVALKWTRFNYWRRLPSNQEDRDFCDRLGRAQAINLDVDNNAERTKAAMDIAEACFNEFDSDRAYSAGAQWGLQYDALRWSDRPRWIYGFEAKVGTEQFKFLDRQSFAERKRDETPRAISGFLGISKPGWGLTYIGLRHEKSFKAQDNATICSPIENSTSLICESGPLGIPAEKEKSVLFVEHRRHIGRFAVSPRVSRDFDSDITGIDMPIYFWKDKAGNLIGGIKVGWQSDTDDIGFSLFIGASFGLFD